MKFEGALKHFVAAFAIAAVAYAGFYYLIETRRTRKGPWEITFHGIEDSPAITIQQPRLGITNVQIVFSGRSLPAGFTNTTLQFRDARPVPFQVPFGEVIFLDTTFLPGTVTLRAFGHEIEAIPRILTIDHSEHQWNPGTLRLVSSNAAPVVNQ